MRLRSLGICLLLIACTPTTHQSFVKRSDAIFKEMIATLETVEHPQDFHQLAALKPLYRELAELMIISLKQEEKNPQLFELEIIEAPHQEELKAQLMRIYSLEGGKEAIEQVAREGLIILQKSPYRLK